MLPAKRLFTTHDTDDRLIVAIIRRDLITARYILESHRYRSTINKTLYFDSCRADLTQPITLLGTIVRRLFLSLFISSLFSSCCLSFWFV